MKLTKLQCALAVALVGFLPTLPAFADIKDYEFRMAAPVVKVGSQTEFAIQLINKVTNKPMPDAVIFATRLDMAPDGMAAMATKIVLKPGDEPGTYKFVGDFSMAGRWQLSLAAKVQGETGTLESKLIIRAEQ